MQHHADTQHLRYLNSWSGIPRSYHLLKVRFWEKVSDQRQSSALGWEGWVIAWSHDSGASVRSVTARWIPKEAKSRWSEKFIASSQHPTERTQNPSEQASESYHWSLNSKFKIFVQQFDRRSIPNFARQQTKISHIEVKLTKKAFS